jgi:hypothetical protein
MSFITGCVGEGRTLAVLAQLDDDDGEPLDAWRLGIWADGDWRHDGPVDFDPVAVAPQPGRPGAWVVLGTNGEALWVDTTGGAPATRQDSIGISPGDSLTALRPFAGGVAAVAMGRHAFHSMGKGWRPLGLGLPPGGPGELVGLEALVEAPDGLHACGWKGEIWRLAGDTWRQVASPTNVILTGGTALPDGRVLFCGRLGMVVIGQGDRWEVMEHDQTEEDFWSATTFRGSTYLASLQGIRELKDDLLEPVDDGMADGSYCRLSSNDTLMLSVGDRTVAITDGDEWKRIL